MKTSKYQALITLASDGDGSSRDALQAPSYRMVVRAPDPENGHSKLFSAMISDQGPLHGSSSRGVLVTMRVVGDDPDGCLSPGVEFVLWGEGPAGKGVITRKLFI